MCSKINIYAYAGEALPVVWGWKGEWLAVGKPPKLLEPLDCPNASKFAKSAFAEFWAVNGKEQYTLMNMKIIKENYDKWI